jgi:hypothetical protein
MWNTVPLPGSASNRKLGRRVRLTMEKAVARPILCRKIWFVKIRIEKYGADAGDGLPLP